LCYKSYIISKMDLSEIGLQVESWIELGQDHVQLQRVLLFLLNFRAELLESLVISNVDLRKLGFEEGM